MLDMHVLDVASGITPLWYNDRIDTPTMLQVGTQPFIMVVRVGGGEGLHTLGSLQCNVASRCALPICPA